MSCWKTQHTSPQGSSSSAASENSSQSGFPALPWSARLPDAERTKKWTNQYGKELPDREVIGDKVLIRQQPPYPPERPQILLLTDQMMEKLPQPDKYIKMFSMFGYSLQDYTRDITDELIELTYPYIIVFLGTMQLGLYDSVKNYQDVSALLKAINAVNDKSHVLISGLVPRPLDYPDSRKRCENYNGSYRLIVQELVRKFNYNIGFIDVFLDFIGFDGKILDEHVNFIDQVFLSVQGARTLRKLWLRHLGFFPKTAVQVASAHVHN